MQMDGQVVVITGASRGIGEAAARVFAAAGARVALLARSAEAINAIADEIGEEALALTCDVSDRASVEGAVEAVIDAFGRIDVLVNNAGVIEPIERLADSDPEGWSRVIDINVKGVYYGMKAVVPHMKAAGGGSVLTISSGAAHNALEGWSAYCTSKAAVHMLTEALHLEEGGSGLRVMGLSPGTVATEMQREIKASGVNAVSKLDWSDHIPPDWPARTLLWMCSAQADDLLGTEVRLRDEDIRRRVGLIE